MDNRKKMILAILLVCVPINILLIWFISKKYVNNEPADAVTATEQICTDDADMQQMKEEILRLQEEVRTLREQQNSPDTTTNK